MPETVDAKILLGWMTEDEALKMLGNCVFEKPMTKDEQLELWKTYRDRVKAIGKRNPLPVTKPHRLTLSEDLAAKSHMRRFQKIGGTNLKRVAKVNALGLIVHQLYVVLDRSEMYEAQMVDHKARLKISLGIGMEYRGTISPAKRNGDVLIKQIPHGEFRPGPMNGPDDFHVQEQARFISFSEFDGKMMLWAGYHRSHALVSHTYPDETERLLVGTLVSDADDFLGAASPLPEKRDMVRGDCPALLSDFFNESLCMRVKLLKLRCELHLDTKARQWKIEMVP